MFSGTAVVMGSDYPYFMEVVYFDTVAFGGTGLWADFLY